MLIILREIKRKALKSAIYQQGHDSGLLKQGKQQTDLLEQWGEWIRIRVK